MTARLSYAMAGEVAWIADSVDHGANTKWLFKRAQEDFEQSAEFHKGDFELTKFDKPKWFWAGMVYDNLYQSLDNYLKRPFSLSLDLKDDKLTIEVLLNDGILVISSPTRRVFSSSSYIFLMWILGSSILLLFVAVLFMRGQVRPIKRLAIAAERLGKGLNSYDLSPSGASEVRKAITAFIDMQERITRHIEQRTIMLAGVSHDLGTMLTRLKLNIAMLPDTSDTKAMTEDIAQMEKMLGGYLEFARGAGQGEFERTNITKLIKTIVEKHQNPKIIIGGDDKADIFAIIRPLAMTRCIENLLINADRYGDKIWISAIKNDNAVEIRVEDNGCGIPENKRQEAFKPFVRLEDARTLSDGGTTGLGLAIVRDIVNAHGGHITIESGSHGGAEILIQLFK